MFELQILEIADRDHVVILLADPEVSVNRFFRPPGPGETVSVPAPPVGGRPRRGDGELPACRKRVNSPERDAAFLHSGFPVLLRDDRRAVEETLSIVEKSFNIV